MNKLLPSLFLGFFFLFFSNAKAQNCTGNLLTNPGFENGLNNWNPQGNATIISTAHTGTKAAKFGGTGYASIGQAFATTAGTSYTASCWARGTGAVELRFLNASWQQILGAGAAVGTTSSSYQELTMTKIAPVGAVYVYLIAWKDGGQTMDVDDFCLASGGTANYPDLVPSNLTVPAIITHGTAFTYSFIAKNNGTAASTATSFSVEIFSYEVARLPLQALQPGQQVTINKTMTLPQNFIFGGSSMTVKLDKADDTVHELQENNNEVFAPLQVNQGTGGQNLSDLSPSNLVAVPTSAAQNTTASVSFTISNLGTAPVFANPLNPATQNHLNAVYLSTNNVLDANDILLNNSAVPMVTPIGAINSLSIVFTVPNGTTAGSYFLLVKLDDDQQVPEQNENNNTAAVPFTVTANAGPCGIVATLEGIECYDNQTPTDPADDQYCVTLNATYTGAGCSSFFTYNQENFTYGSSITICGFPANGTPPSLTLYDSGNSAVQTTVTAQPPAGCSNVGNTCPGNLLQNPGFETGSISGWNIQNSYPNSSGTVSNDAHSGSYAFVGRSTSISQTISTTPGKQYTMRVWAKTTNPQSSYIHFNIYSNTSPILGALTYITSSNYAEYSVAFIAPSNAVTANAHLTTNGDSFTYVDDFCVTESIPTCAITASASNVQCHDNGTATLATDDYFTYDFTAHKTGDCGTRWFIGSVVETTYPYGSVQTTGPQPISNGPSQLGIHDATIQNVNYTLTVQPPPTCSNGGAGQIDLSLALLQTPAAPAQWQNYSIKATISNAGPQTATGVKVSFKKPAGVVYAGGNEFVASQGSFAPFGNEEWMVGSIPANGSATLTVNYFLLQTQTSVAYAQVVAANETDADSQPNNGTPPTPVQDDEASTVSIPPNLFTDLVLTTFSIPVSGGLPGGVANYLTSVANIGNTTAPGNYVIGAYLSTDLALSGDDILVGVINTGNTPPGTIHNVPGSITIPANLPPGVYFIMLKTDIYDNIAESNENNNISSVTVFVINNGNNPPCNGNLLINPGFEDGLNGWSGTGPSSLVVDAHSGMQALKIPGPSSNLGNIWTQTLSFQPGTEYTLRVWAKIEGAPGSHAFILMNAYPNGASNAFAVTSNTWQEYTIPMTTSAIPAQPGVLEVVLIKSTATAFYVDDICLTSNAVSTVCQGDLILESQAEVNAMPDCSIVDGNLWIRSPNGSQGASSDITDLSPLLGIQQVNGFITIENNDQLFNLHGLENIKSAEGVAVVFCENLNQVHAFSGLTGEMKSINILSNPSLLSVDGFEGITSLSIGINLTTNTSLQNLNGFSNITHISKEVHIGGNTSLTSMQGLNKLTSIGEGFIIENCDALQTLNGLQHLQSVGYLALLSNDALQDVSALGALSTVQNSLFVNEHPLLSDCCVFYNLLNNNGVGGSITFGDNAGNCNAAQDILNSCSGSTDPCAAITITNGPNKITIAGAVAPHVLIKVFRPNWTVAYECLDGACANPTVVTGLGAGSHFVEVKLLNSGWSEICKEEQTVGVSSIIAKQDDRLRLSFDKFYPNPTAYLTTIDLYSPVEQAATLDFYDRTGRLVHSMDVQLEEGQNSFEQFVFDWKSGTYNIIARGEETALPAYGRFLKVWEE